MVSLKGMIIRCSSVIPEIRESVFRCLVCGYYSDPILVDRGNCWLELLTVSQCVDYYFTFVAITGYVLSNLFELPGRINEPTICGKQECLSRNSMTLVHNRCR